MKSTKIVACAMSLALAGGILAGCSSTEGSSSSAASSASSSAAVEVSQIEMKYITPADVEANLGNDDYLVVDLRKAADYEAGHIPGAISADMDAAVNGDNQAGIDTMTAALQEATGSDVAEGKTLVLVCYSGAKYAQAGTNLLGAMGADMDSVYTLEGGMKAWTGETVTD